MTNASAKTLSEATAALDIKEIFDRQIKDGDTADLVRRLIGEDAEARLRGHGSLWRLLEEREPGLHWLEQERLDILAELVARLGTEARRPDAVGIDGPESAAVLFSHLALLDHEELWVAYLNNKNIPLAVIQVGIGSLSSVVGFPHRIFREALLRNANGVIVAHNHPSGDPSPSASDRHFARELADGAVLVGIRLVDNLVIGGEGRVHSMQTRRDIQLQRPH
jgi:DNA repair protein RadC